MLPTNARRRFAACLSGLLMMLAAPAAHADPIQPSYTLTDLGTGNPTFSTDASGNGIVIAPNGQTAYAFPQTFTGTPMGGPTPAGFPLPPAAPSIDPNFNVTSWAMNPTLYPNGVAFALQLVSTYEGDYGWQQYNLYYTQRNPDGSWGQPVMLQPGPVLEGPPIGQSPGVEYWYSKSGNVLEAWQANGEYGPLSDSVYNMSTHSYINMATLPAIVDNGFALLTKYAVSPINFQILGMDDDGRILLEATHFANPNDVNSANGEELLLLTPAGVSSDPIALNAPEPASWAVMAMFIGALAAHHARQRMNPQR